MMFDLFKWGFILAMLLTWLAIGLGALLLLIPGDSRKRPSYASPVQKRAA